MKLSKFCIATLLILIIPSFLIAASFEGKVVGISDGDTLKALKDGKQVKIRLAVIDCPEKKQSEFYYLN